MVDQASKSEARDLPPMHARDLLAGFRDLGVGGEGNEKLLACDASFNRYSAFWVLGQTLDAAYAAAEGMVLLFRNRALEFFAKSTDSILSFLAERFDPEAGRFVTDSSRRTRGIFAYHAAVGLVRSLEGLTPKQRLSGGVFDRYIRDIGQQPAAARRGVEEMIDSAREDEGLVENPEAPLIPSLTALYTASSLLWYLSSADSRSKTEKPEILRFIEPRRLERFLDGCIKRQRVGERTIAGFTVHPDHWELCVNTTSFGLRLREFLRFPLEPELAREIESFLNLAYRDGGFSSTLWEPRSLNATYLGLKALRLVMCESGRANAWSDFLKREKTAILGFVRQCTNPATGGSPFAPDFERYRDNCLATRYRIQIFRLLGAVLSREEAEAAYQFFQRQFDESSGGFRAYPEDQVTAEGFGPAELEAFLESKDHALMAKHRARLEDPGRPLSFRPDARTAALYARLAELRQRTCRDDREAEQIERQLQSTWEELRVRQRAGARRYEELFDAQVLLPLRERRARLEELEERLAEG